jgi:class 3 adenylate cyclase/HEAT repeat protein
MTSLFAPTKSRGLRAAIALAGVALAYVVALSFYKSALLQEVAQQGAQSLPPRHAQVTRLFQASFYFFYEDQFLPGVRQQLKADIYPRIERLRVVSNDVSIGKGAAVLFDSDAPRKPAEGSNDLLKLDEPQIMAALTALAGSKEPSATPKVFYNGFRIEALMPGSQYSVLYTFDASQVRNRVFLALALGFLLLFGTRWVLSSLLVRRMGGGVLRWWKDFWRLRVKFLAAIVLINLLTATIVFYSLTSLQTRSQTERIKRDSLLFSQFSTAQVISNFTSFFYFYYADRFIPETKKIIASNENLLGMRILSCRTGGVLFDSEQADLAPQLGGLDNAKADFPAEIEEQLRSRDLATRVTERGGEPLLLVVNTYRNESQEPTFWVEYRYSFQSLAASIQAIRHQILFDLIPSLALGLLIAAVFAQLLIAPIRKLMGALGRVSAGDYEARVDFARARGDEIGDLGQAFNAMTEELRKKKELRKYLSDSTYRQVMRAPDSPGGLKLGGSRVSATILFSDIRNFVGHCESLEAEEVTAMLNEYFSEMVEVVYKHGGEIDKFIGDALLAVFYAADESRTIAPDGGQGAPSAPSASGTSLQAMYCALEMRERLKEFNQRRRTAGKAEIDTGVGISHGEIISGPIGAKDRMDFTVIGDVVNLASRIEKLSKRGRHTKIVFSQQIQEMVRDLLDYEELGVEKVAGKEESVRVFELVGVKKIETLVSHLSSKDLALRRRSVELLGHSRNPDALPHLISRFGDPDELTRLQAVLAAARLAHPGEGTSSLFDAFVSCLAKERSEKVLSALIAAVGRLSASGGESVFAPESPGSSPAAPADVTPTDAAYVERLIQALQPYLDSSNERIVANAIEALGQARDPRCTDLILPKLGSRHNRVKANAAMALFAAGHIEVIDTLKPMLMHSDPLMRSSAAFAIGELTVIAGQDQLVSYWKAQAPVLKLFLGELQECVPMLVACLRDPETAVRRQAIIALGKIKDKSAVLPIIDLLDPARGGKELLADISQALASIGSHKLVREVIARLSST